jgi:hypothetical protein
MARRFDAIYRVKPKDNLGDPEYWNRRFDDIDRRVSSNEDGLDAIGGLTAYVEGLALNRLDLVLAPALDKITLVSEQGFLLAHSHSSVTLDVNTTQTFAIPDAAERELFAPSPFLTITREANMTDYAFARLISWNKVSGQLVVQPLQIMGNSGPFTDWVIYVGTAISQTVATILQQTIDARNTAVGYRDQSAASAASAASDKTTVALMKSDTLAARDAALLAAQNAQTWDPTNYALTTDVVSRINTAVNGLLNGAPGALDTLKELADAIGDDANFASTVTTALSNRLRVDINNQALTSTQKTNAQTNLGLGSVAVKNIATAAEIKNNTNAGAVTVDNAWTAAAYVDLGNSGSGNLNVDCSLGSRFRVILTGNVTVNFINPKDGQVVDIVFLQDASGGRTISWNGNVRFPNGIAPLLATNANGWACVVSGVYCPGYGQWLAAGWKVT